MRLDKYLKTARILKRREAAKELALQGRIWVNDRVKLFGAINDISRKINLKLESGKIKIMISKRLKKHIELLIQVIDKLEGEF